MEPLFKAHILNPSQSIPTNQLGHNICGPSEGIPYRSLDAMSAHVKCLIARHYQSEILSKNAFNPQQWAMVSPGGVESFARLLAYPEVEQDRLKELLNMTSTIVTKNWFFGAHLLAELFTFRLHRIPTSVRVQMLQHFSQILATPQHAGHPQLYCAYEFSIRFFWRKRKGIFSFRIQNLLLNLLLQFNCTDLYNQVPKMIESKMLNSTFNKEAEEINKVYILCIARSFIVTGKKNSSHPMISPLSPHFH